ncbi:hypothetical protein [Streptomyces nigrescens]
MHALVIVHGHLSTAGHVGERLVERGYELEEMLVVPAERYTNPDVDVVFPAAEDYGLILTLGAPWSVARRNAWIEAELALLRSAHEPRGGLHVPAERGGRRSWFPFHGDRRRLPPGAREPAHTDVTSTGGWPNCGQICLPYARGPARWWTLSLIT